jgi:uncharacterized protein (DUF2237 family)
MKKLWRTVAALAGMALLLALVTSRGTLADVQTDRDDYAPGETVTITGDGMAPGETVVVEVYYPDGTLAQRHEVVADENGNFTDTFVLPGPEAPVYGTYAVVATGRTSGKVFRTTFTDGNVKVFARPPGVTFTLTWTTYYTSNCTGPAKGTGTDIVDSTSGKTFGVGHTESIKLEAAPTSHQGGAFINWTSSDPFTGTNPICVRGFTAGGSRNYYANYSTATPTSTITTKVQDANHNDITGSSVPLGSVVHDKATVETTVNPIPAGSTVTFQFFTNGECSGDPHSVENVALTGGSTSESVESSATAPLPAGSYSYKAKFNSGNTSQVPDADSDCEPFTVLKGTPTVTTELHTADESVVASGGSVPLGTSMHDKATVSGIAAFTPTGTVTFTFYNNGSCEGTGTDAGTVALVAGVAHPSSAFGPLAAGSYSFKAHYSGDDNYNEADSDCEPFTVLKGTPTVTTELHTADESVVASGGSVPLGTSMHDKATVSGIAAFTPTGTVTFTFYNNGSCEGTGTDAGTVALVAGVAHPSSAFGPLAAGSYSFKAHYSGDDNYNEADSDCEPFTVLKATPTVTTAIHLMPEHVVVTSVTMGATIHDEATVTGIAAFTPTGTVTFTLYRSNNCTGEVVQTSTGTLSGSGASATAESSPDYLTTAADIPALSFKAHYNGDDNYNEAASDCEPLTVLSSIIAFYYEVIGGPDAGDNPGTFNCTLPASEKGTSTPCPSGTTAASITEGATNTYRLHVVVANYTGVPIREKVQGGLTAAPGAQYSNLQVTCGNAKINVSKSRGGHGNVVVWDSVGDGKTNNPGFTMNPGDVCELTVDITVKFSGTGLQPLTGSWSEFQCLLDGPNKGFCEKSPYTNSLMVVVS